VATTSAGTTSQVQYAFFRTSGPPTDLTPYLAATIPAQGGGPHFGAYDLSYTFTQNYVREMYGTELSLQLVDDNGTAVVDADGTALMTLVGSGISATFTYSTSAWLGALSDAGLVDSGTAEPARNDVLVTRLTGTAALPAGRRLEARLVYDGSPVLALPFTSSRYADFTALIGDFDPTLWDEMLPDGMPSQAGQAELQAIAIERAAATGPFTDAEGEQLDHALYDLLGSPTRPLPPRPALTALRSAGNAVALLLDLPEPVEWDRLGLTIRAAGRVVGAARVRGIDGTRALLLIPGSSGASQVQPWSAGTYTWTFVYTLDLGDDSLPVLSRRGSSLPEAPPGVRLRLSRPARSRP
jgi:hypothetical protein